ncbi:MAG: flagellar biosynthesis anti-sigma factor FlgM [Piscirickettsiaceae bacterium]|nr:flagellar biosynthesis anti-sigma factor FlgM [Piscirickettsiaceae bacterium]
MSVIDNIKPSGQSTVDTARNVNTQDTVNANKSGNVQTNEARTDTVSLTNTATDLQALQQTISDSSGVDQARIDAFRSAIENGTYQVDVTELAQNIINIEQ